MTNIDLLKDVIANAVSILQDLDEDMSDFCQLDKEYKLYPRDPDNTLTYAIIFNYSNPKHIVTVLIQQIFKLQVPEEQKEQLIYLVLSHDLREIQGQYQMFWYCLAFTQNDVTVKDKEEEEDLDEGINSRIYSN